MSSGLSVVLDGSRRSTEVLMLLVVRGMSTNVLEEPVRGFHTGDPRRAAEIRHVLRGAEEYGLVKQIERRGTAISRVSPSPKVDLREV